MSRNEAPPPEPAPAPQPIVIPAVPATPEAPKKSSRKIIIAVILIVAIVVGASSFAYVYTQTSIFRSASSPSTQTSAGYNAYSNWGFSFQYPKTMTITERGLLDSTATSSSGLVEGQSSTSQNDVFIIAWTHSVNSIDPSTVLSGAINGFQQGSGGYGLSIGQPASATTKAGYHVVYQSFSSTVSGTHVQGVWSAWYSTQGQRLYQLAVVTSGSNAVNLYNTYLSSFTEL